MYCTVVASSKSGGIGNGLTYETDDPAAAPGMLVRVPLRNKIVEGIIIEASETRDDSAYDLKRIKEVVGDSPLLSGAQLGTLRWMAEHYLTTLRQALAVWLPPPPWIRLLPKQAVAYHLLKADTDSVRGKKQIDVIEYLRGHDEVLEEALRADLDVGAATLKTLVERGIVERRVTREKWADVAVHHESLKGLPALTPAQQAVADSLRRDPRPSLLFGITGSGKTEIYAQLIADALKEGKQAIVLVPEILLTEHSIHRYEALLHRERIAVVHSRLADGARRELWRKIRRGDIALVLGSRSALFSPVRSLGLIVIDEEHEWTFKNEQTPRYHARETAQMLCEEAKAKLVLGTATPSLESWLRAKVGTYQMERLPMRYKDQALPNVRIIDLAEVSFGTLYPFSPPLLDAIQERLQRREQSVLFLNRRGVATALLCLTCRRRVVSPESQLPFTVHHGADGRPFLLDHTSGLTVDVPAECPHCQSTQLLAVGAGTQKIEHILQRRFPQARLLRADADTIGSPEEMRSLLATMRERRADILLGTQSVVKGLDLPEVTLAAVVLADVGLSLPHFRAGERIFQLLTQLTGRSGRAKQGEVIIQTFRPNATEIVSASRHETEQYLDQELKLRAYTGYPPAAEMVRLILRDDDPGGRAKALAMDLQKAIDASAARASVKFAPTFFGGGREWHVLIRGEKVRDLLHQVKLEDVVVDVDPMQTV